MQMAGADLKSRGMGGFNQQHFKVDPFDYVPTRFGLRQNYRAIVVEYTLKSRMGARFLHNIKVGRYVDPMSFGISVSKSGSFAEALEGEVERVTDRVYGDHCEYLPPEKISRVQIEGLVSEILTFSRSSSRNNHNNQNN